MNKKKKIISIALIILLLAAIFILVVISNTITCTILTCGTIYGIITMSVAGGYRFRKVKNLSAMHPADLRG